MKRTASVVACLAATAAAGCASIMATVGSGMAENLNTAILNQDDPEVVRDGAPAYLLMLDSLVEGAPENAAVLSAAAQLYAAYGAVFVDDPSRARKLTKRALSYGQRAICETQDEACGIWKLNYEEFVPRLRLLREGDADVLYTFGLTWIAYIQAHGDDWSALARLPQAQAVLRHLREVNPGYKQADVEHYLAVLDTIRPPALGGDFESGQAHYERAIELSSGRDLGIKVDYARFYARTLYDRELHDRLLHEVLQADPEQQNYTLFNTLAQEKAKELLSSADDYF